MQHTAFLLFALASATGLLAQANVVPGLDGRVSTIDDLYYFDRRGAAHPNGEVGVAMQSALCNAGAVPIPWQMAMAQNHPKFAFLLARVSGDRIEQINNWSYVQHAAVAANASGACGTCIDPGTTQLLGIQCSGTHSSSINGDRYWLAPASEVNPWLGTWTAVGSHFDRGDPPAVGAPATDGIRSLTNAQVAAFDEVKNRVTVREQDLLTTGASYYYGIQLVHQGEAVANRGDNLASRGTTPQWNGTAWTFPNNTAGMTHGSILSRWPGAEVNAGQNGNDDGRFFVAGKVTPLGAGNYHYEYAVHNADNDRGGATFRVPIDAAATASNFTFGDIDLLPTNEWTGARVGNEVVFTAPANNPLNWGTIYNFGFDANFAPGAGLATLAQARPGPGAPSVTVQTKVPSGATTAQWSPVGTGCGGGNCPASFYEFFSPASTFDLANTSWSLAFNGNGYTLGPGTGTYIAPAGLNLAMADDSEVQTWVLPFAIPFPGGTTNRLWVCSNGFVSPASNGASHIPSPAAFVSGGLRWAALWHDLAPTTGQVKVDATASRVVISFTGVANYGLLSTATFQFQFFPNGNVNVVYQAIAANGNDYLVGYTPGGGIDPGSWNISTNLAGGLSLCSSPPQPLALAANARPILGTTMPLVTSNIPANTIAGMWLLSLTQHSPGIDLGALGMPGCRLYVGADPTAGDVFSLFVPTGTSTTLGWSIPNVPAASGLVVMTQSAALGVSANAFGAITSNAIQMLLGVN